MDPSRAEGEEKNGPKGKKCRVGDQKKKTEKTGEQNISPQVR
jgi:hypothetical protein